MNNQLRDAADAYLARMRRNEKMNVACPECKTSVVVGVDLDINRDGHIDGVIVQCTKCNQEWGMEYR